jgi:hypothetical protein
MPHSSRNQLLLLCHCHQLLLARAVTVALLLREVPSTLLPVLVLLLVVCGSACSLRPASLVL